MIRFWLMANKILEKLKSFMQGEATPVFRIGMMGYVIVPRRNPGVLQTSTNEHGTAVRVWVNPAEAEDFRKMLEPLGTSDYVVRPVVLHPPQ